MAFKCPKDRNQGVRDQGIWEAIPQDQADQSMLLETNNPNTGAWKYVWKLMCGCMETYGPACISVTVRHFLFALDKNISLGSCSYFHSSSFCFLHNFLAEACE